MVNFPANNLCLFNLLGIMNAYATTATKFTKEDSLLI